MKIESNYFGTIEVSDDQLIFFESAIPGFEELQKFFVIREETPDSEEDDLFCWLHSVENNAVAFALLDVFKVKNDYKPEIEEQYLNQIAYVEGDEIAVYNIANIPEKVDEMTVNLLAPVVLNLSKMKGVQAIVNNEDYSLKHKIFQDIRKNAEKITQKEEE